MKTITQKQTWKTKSVSAERTGFEPAKPFGGLHAFQACLFNHSSTSPCLRLQNYEIIFEYQKLLSHFRWHDGKSPLQ